MTILTATTAGSVTGYFDVPASVPTGTKLVQFYGSTASGTYAEATFVGRGIVTTRELQQINTIVTKETWTWAGDPVAQTFTMPTDTMICGVDILFSAKGASNVVCSIRECNNGFPTQTAIAGALLTPAQINSATSTSNTWTRFTWPATLCMASQEYAICLFADDATVAVRCAELGGFDTITQNWVTQQAYNIGVLLTSSNGSTWTPDQTSDLSFRLLKPTYTPVNTSTGVVNRAITMTSTSATSADYITVRAAVERPTNATDCVFEIKTYYPSSASTQVYTVTEGQPLLLPIQYTGKVDCTAFLTGTLNASPRLHKDVEIVCGKGRTTGTYISRAIPCNATSASSSKMTVNLTALLPQGSALDIRAQITTATSPVVWSTSAFSLTSTVDIGDGWNDLVYNNVGISSLTVSSTRIKITLTGTPQAMPMVKNLQAYCVAI